MSGTKIPRFNVKRRRVGGKGEIKQKEKDPLIGAPSTGGSRGDEQTVKITDYVLGPLQMYCMRQFAAGKCSRLEITPGWKVPFIDGISIGPPSENRDKPAVMRCVRNIYSRDTGAYLYTEYKVIDIELMPSRCSKLSEETGLRYDDKEGF